MIKKWVIALVALLTMGVACAQIEVNQADQAALDGLKGIGPKLSRTILNERRQGGDFKDWNDFGKRVKGVGAKSTDKLSQAGLLINGQPKPGAPAASVKPAVPVPATPDR